MSTFSVDPDALASTAGAVRKLVDAAAPHTPTEHPSDVGHDGLADAIGHFASRTDDAWRARVDDLRRIPDALDDSAATYENADNEAAATIRRADGGL
ncbi:hypothetical protein [uncultured Microbacterium sp.]|uniref:hypothetical protein n=1 Tax=uncultured Microbacterium sp. TaxID=191216 RepID=UPI0025F4BFA9|nr:hypothetical protein [uncultured Microbacterium sp.]